MFVKKTLVKGLWFVAIVDEDTEDVIPLLCKGGEEQADRLIGELLQCGNIDGQLEADRID